MNQSLIEKYAQLVVQIGVNVQEGQVVSINAPVHCADFARAITHAAYETGAKKVIVNWRDDEINRYNYDYQDEETLTSIPQYLVDAKLHPFEEGGCIISITSPIPEIFKGLDSKKIAKANRANDLAFKEVHSYTMSSKARWCVIAAPNPVWAKKIFPEDESDVANEKLWEKILSAVHVRLDNNPIEEWKQHNATLAHRVELLNQKHFKSLHFTNSLGTDLIVGLAKTHLWGGGDELCSRSIAFTANMPTEEVFTCPDKYEVNGIVYSTKPLDYQGKLIENFKLVFKDGRVSECFAEKEEEALLELLNADEGSRYLGEVALVEYNSPISLSNILFYNTLFDENASCHLALGEAYPTTIENGAEMDDAKLLAAGANHSMQHCDFMFGSSDMQVVATSYDGEEVVIFDQGNFII